MKHTTNFSVADKEKAQRDKGSGRILLGDNKTAVWRSYYGRSGSGVLGLGLQLVSLVYAYTVLVHIHKQWGSVRHKVKYGRGSEGERCEWSG